MSESELSAAESEIWHAAKKFGERLFARIEADIYAASGLSGADLTVLLKLSDLGRGRLSQQDLAKSTGWHKSRLSHQLTRMEKRQLVERRPLGRFVEVLMLPTGQHLLTVAMPAYANAVRTHLLARLTNEEAETFLALCTKISLDNPLP